MAGRTTDTSLSATITLSGSIVSLETTLSDFERDLHPGPSRQRLARFLADRDPNLARYCHQHDKFFEKKGTFQAHLEKQHGLCNKRTDFLMILNLIWAYQRPRTDAPVAASAASWTEPATDSALGSHSTPTSSAPVVESVQNELQVGPRGGPSPPTDTGGIYQSISNQGGSVDNDLDFLGWQAEGGSVHDWYGQ